MKTLFALLLLLLFPSLAFGQGGFAPLGATKVVFTDATGGTTNTTTFTGAATTPYTLTFPPTAGTNTYVLTTNGSGVLSWSNPAGTSVSSWSAGTTGFTPSSATTGVVTLGGILNLASGGTSANLTASNGGIFYSTASAGAILAGTATANQILMSGASITPAWSTATYPATTTINQLLYSSAANTIAGITTANNEILVTNTSGIPAWSTTLPSGVTGYVSSVTNSDGTVTISPTTGAVVASLALAHANTWTGAQIYNANVTHGSGTIYTEQTPATLAVSTNNLALPAQTYMYLNASAAVQLTGIAAGVDGQRIIIVNPSAFAITLVEQSASSTAGNRFLFSNTIGGANNCILAPQACIELMYDNTNVFNAITGWWRFVSHN